MLIALAAITMVDALDAGDHKRSLDVDGRTRRYLVHVPPSYDRETPTPLVLAYHGGATNADIMVRFCGLNDKADQEGFIVAYPYGTGERERLLTWNAGNCCGWAMRHKVDDVAFAKALLNDLEQAAKIDPKRIYATGMSNGALMSYLLADELSERIAAIAPVGGPMGRETCHPKRPVSVVHFHGTADEFAPYQGGRGRRSVSQTNFYSVAHSISAWVKANGCESTPTTETVIENDNGMTVVRSTYGAGKAGAEVVLYTIEGGGHTWPGRNSLIGFLGKSTTVFSANDVMWDFFQKHPMK